MGNNRSLTPEAMSKEIREFRETELTPSMMDANAGDNTVMKMKIRDLLRYTETLLEGLEAESKLLDK